MSRWDSAEFTEELRHASWMAAVPVLMYLNERATGDPAREWLSGWARRYFIGDDLRVLVVGCGEGWLERLISEWPFIRAIDASASDNTSPTSGTWARSWSWSRPIARRRRLSPKPCRPSRHARRCERWCRAARSRFWRGGAHWSSTTWSRRAMSRACRSATWTTCRSTTAWSSAGSSGRTSRTRTGCGTPRRSA